MPASFIIAIAALIVGGLLLAGLSVVTWQRRSDTTGDALSILLAAIALWVLFAAVEHIVPSLAGKILASKIQWLGALIVPPASVCTILIYLRLNRWLRPYLYISGPIAVLSYLIVISNGFHHWHWTDIQLDSSAALPLLQLGHGPAYWVINLICHTQLLIAALLFLPSSLKSWQMESTLVYIGLSAPWIANLMHISGTSVIPNLDITPFGLIITGLCFAISFQGMGSIFSTIKLANRQIVESISDLILVVDSRKQLLAANKSARRILTSHPLPAPIDVMLAKHQALLEYLHNPPSTAEHDIEIVVGGKKITYDIRSVDTDGRRGKRYSTVYVLRDATDQRAYEKDLQRHRKQLRQIIDLIPHPIYARDSDGRFLLANDSASQAYGFGGKSIEGHTIDELHPIADEAERIRQGDRNVIDGKQPITSEQIYENRHGEPRIFQNIKMPFAYNDDEAPGIVGISLDMTETRERERLLTSLASTDPLTSLPNRRQFQDVLGKALARAAKSSHRMALLSMDLDRFKMVNDNYGHPVGDAVLTETAARFRKNLRFDDQITRSEVESDQMSVSRLGGDEFMVLLPNISGSGDAAVVARRLIDALEEPFLIESNRLQLGSSVGIAIYPDDGTEAETLIQHCDRALTSAKENFRGSFVFYNADLGIAEERRHTIEQALRRAFDQNEFKMHYQPIFDAETSRLSGAEALLRWESAELGAVGPDEFIPVAEESGLILRIGETVFRSVCEQIAQWKAAGFKLPVISVNLSARQLVDANLQDQIDGALRDTGVCGAEIEFELTEGSILAENPKVEETLSWLKALGSSLALDDFGTGYSSLSHLRRFSFDRLKIDRSFVSGLGSSSDDEQLVRGVIALAERLNIQTIAEGVETELQLEILRGEGCNYIQGYLLGRPQPPESFEQFLKSSS